MVDVVGDNQKREREREKQRAQNNGSKLHTIRSTRQPSRAPVQCHMIDTLTRALHQQASFPAVTEVNPVRPGRAPEQSWLQRNIVPGLGAGVLRVLVACCWGLWGSVQGVAVRPPVGETRGLGRSNDLGLVWSRYGITALGKCCPARSTCRVALCWAAIAAGLSPFCPSADHSIALSRNLDCVHPVPLPPASSIRRPSTTPAATM